MNIVKKKLGQNCSKIYSKTHQIAPFLKNFLGGACPRSPLANACLCHAQHDASRYANTLTY